MKKNSFIYDIFGSNYLVNSAHHQSVKRIAPNFKTTAVSPDGIIEAIELVDEKIVIGIQWHPEMMASNDEITLKLFRKFIDCCK